MAADTTQETSQLDDIEARPGQELTAIELQVLRRMAAGHRNIEIEQALELQRSEMIKIQLSMQHKLGANSVHHMISRAWFLGVLTSRVLSVLLILASIPFSSDEMIRPKPQGRIAVKVAKGAWRGRFGNV